MNEEQMRAEFEESYNNDMPFSVADDTFMRHWQNHCYEDIGVQIAWTAWQACQAVNDERIARLREAYKEAILGLRKIEYIYSDERVGELAKIFIDNANKKLENNQ